MGIPRALFYSQRCVLAATAFSSADREIDVALAFDLEAAQSCVSVTPTTQPYVVPDGVVRVVNQLRQILGQIQPLGTPSPVIDFLQQDQIGIVVVEDVGYPVEPKTAVETDSAVYVVR
jgi:hypothetical protein